MATRNDHMWGDTIGSTYGATIEQRLREADGWQAELEALQDDDPASVRRVRLAELAAETISFFLLIAAIVAAFIVFSPSEAQAATRDVITDPTFWQYFAGGVGVLYVAVIALYTIILIRDDRE